LSLRWGPESTLEIRTLESTVTLTHKNIDDRITFGAAWHGALDLLSHVMAGGSRESFDENFEALLPEYKRLIERVSNQGTR
jgi:hypothetical protein